MTGPTARDELRDRLDETQRMLEYLWTATGSRAPDMPVCDLFNDDDPLVQDIPTVLGKARMALAAARSEAPGELDALDAFAEMMEHADKGETWADVLDSARYVIRTDGLPVLLARLREARS